ncbi:MAG: hypothetical protein KC431_20325, partial [Myxococcales bacterium]|nr:hypothetical protein [Myxococcales bacterium]
MNTQNRPLTLFLCLTLTAGGCSLTPPAQSPEDQRAFEAARSRKQQALADQAGLAAEHEAASPQREVLQAELDRIDGDQQAALAAHRADEQAHADYRQRIVDARSFAGDCRAQAENGPLIAGERGRA